LTHSIAGDGDVVRLFSFSSTYESSLTMLRSDGLPVTVTREVTSNDTPICPPSDSWNCTFLMSGRPSMSGLI
jgi:hypothetical protein